MFVSGMKKPLLIASLVLALALSACGDFEEEYSQAGKVGPAGPTIPGGYYFDLTLSPSVVQLGDSNSSVTIKAHVWDANGVGVSNVTVYYGGDFDAGDTNFTTDSNGYSTATATITGTITVGNRQYITAEVEDTSLTAPYMVIPLGGI